MRMRVAPVSLALQSRLRLDGCEYQQIKARCVAWLARRALPIFFLFNLINVAFSWAKISLALSCDPFHLYDCIWDGDDDQLAPVSTSTVTGLAF